MLGDSEVSTMLAVRDLARAKKFYEDMLGLYVESENPYEVRYRSGDSHVATYVSDLAGTNEATAATWEVDDIQKVVNDLKAKGVDFEHYDMKGTKRDGDIHFMGDELAAWFKDPDGNILCLHAEV